MSSRSSRTARGETRASQTEVSPSVNNVQMNTSALYPDLQPGPSGLRPPTPEEINDFTFDFSFDASLGLSSKFSNWGESALHETGGPGPQLTSSGETGDSQSSFQELDDFTFNSSFDPTLGLTSVFSNWGKTAVQDTAVPQPEEQQADQRPEPSKLEKIALENPSDPQRNPSEPKPAASRPARQTLYSVGKLLGRGGFSDVCEGFRRSDGQKVAMKFIFKSLSERYVNIPGHSEPLLAEVALNLLLHSPKRCPYIVQLFDWFKEKQGHVLIMEFPHPCMNLVDFISHKRGRLTESLARHLMRHAVIASKHFIDQGVYHGSLNINNVLVNTETMTLKVIDFGCGQLVSDCGLKGTYSGHKFAVADTVQSLGILMIKMACGHDDWMSYNEVLKDDPFMKRLGLSREFLDLKNRCLSHPVEKPSLEEILDHEWFKMS